MYIVKKIKHAFRRSSVLLLIYSFFQRINYRKTKSKMDLRKDLNIFSYKEISKPLRMLFIDKFPENNLYGMSYIIKEFIGIESKYLLEIIENKFLVQILILLNRKRKFA